MNRLHRWGRRAWRPRLGIFVNPGRAAASRSTSWWWGTPTLPTAGHGAEGLGHGGQPSQKPRRDRRSHVPAAASRGRPGRGLSAMGADRCMASAVHPALANRALDLWGWARSGHDRPRTSSSFEGSRWRDTEGDVRASPSRFPRRPSSARLGSDAGEVGEATGGGLRTGVQGTSTRGSLRGWKRRTLAVPRTADVVSSTGDECRVADR